MIDEELYQQAADELNTDRRRAHIWARACALASDDHDEARYLYTNLRVEELIAERESGGAGAIAGAQTADAEEQHDATLALEPVSFESGTDGEITDFSDDDEFTLGEADEIPSSVSAPSGMDLKHDQTSDDLFQLLPTELDNEPDAPETFGSERADFSERAEMYIGRPEAPPPESVSENELAPESPMERDFREKASSDLRLDNTFDDTAELDGTAVIDFDSEELAEFQASIPAEDFDTFEAQAAASLDNSRDALQQNNDELDDLLDGVYPGNNGTGAVQDDAEAVLTADFSDASGTQAIMVDDDLDWLDDEVASDTSDKPLQAFQPEASSHDDTDRFTQELERQAEELPGQHSDVVAHNPPAQPDISTAAEPEETTREDAIPDSQVAAAAVAAGTAAAAFTSAPSSRTREWDYPLDLSDEGEGAHYSVYRRDQSLQAVKSGVSWSALILTLPYLIYRHLFGTAIMYVIMAVILLAGLLVMGLAWFDAGITATPLVKAGTIGFGLMAVIGLLYLPFRHGNTWRGEKLESRGYELIAWVRARSPGKAISAARRAAALD